jgi:hypothetical protein
MLSACKVTPPRYIHAYIKFDQYVLQQGSAGRFLKVGLHVSNVIV